MLLKSADSKDARISDLSRRLDAAQGGYRRKLEEELRILKAGIKAESEVAYLINFDYEKSQNWAIIHDLRLEIGGRVAQIDHLLLNRFLEVFVLETKSFHSGLKINEDGEFLRWNDYRDKYEGMPSPLAQNERHITVLKDAFKEIKTPTKLGVALTPSFHSFVLISANARVDRPKAFDASKVIKADALKATIDKQIDKMGVLEAFGSLAKLVDEGTLYAIARRLVGLHKPLHPEPEEAEAPIMVGASSPTDSSQPKGLQATIDPSRPPEPTSKAIPLAGSGPLSMAATRDPALPATCKSCGKHDGSILYGHYGYYFKCSACATNTSMKWNCGISGHGPRVRKDGPRFYRECQGCNISTLFHVNPDL